MPYNWLCANVNGVYLKTQISSFDARRWHNDAWFLTYQAPRGPGFFPGSLLLRTENDRAWVLSENGYILNNYRGPKKKAPDMGA